MIQGIEQYIYKKGLFEYTIRIKLDDIGTLTNLIWHLFTEDKINIVISVCDRKWRQQKL